jgi:hypothetical protein
LSATRIWSEYVGATTKLYGASFGSVSGSAYDADMNGSSSAETLLDSASESPVPQPWIAIAPSLMYCL